METLPDIHGATAKVRDAKELTLQVSPDLSEVRTAWSLSLTCSDLGGDDYEANHKLYNRLMRAKIGESGIKVTIEFQDSEMNLDQAQMFDADGNVISAESPDSEGVSQAVDAADADWTEPPGESTVTDGPVPDADGVVRRTYKINGVEHEFGVDSTEPEGGEGSPEQEKEFQEAAADGAPEEFQEPARTLRSRSGGAASAIDSDQSD